MYKIEEYKDCGDGLVSNIIGIFDNVTIAKDALDKYILDLIKMYKNIYKNIEYTAIWDNDSLRLAVKNFPELSATYILTQININQLF